MQIKLISVPVLGGEAMNEELNSFLRSKKIIQIEQHLVNDSGGAFWCFCIKYTEDYSPLGRNKEKVDYKQVLDEASFQRFSSLRTIRKKLAEAEGIPAFAIFTDEELAGLAQIEMLTLGAMKSVKGIGEKKISKYGRHFTTEPADEKSQSPD